MQSWPTNVNKKAYGLEVNTNSNYTEVSFESGQKRRFLNDTRAHKKYSFKLAMDDSPTDANSEYKQFLDWYENTLFSGALTFEFIDFDNVKNTKEYFFADAPSVSGQKIKEVSLSVEEA